MKEKLFDFIDGSGRGMIELEKLLTSHQALAPENGGQGEAEKCDALMAWLKEQGITDIRRYDAPDPRVQKGDIAHVRSSKAGVDMVGRITAVTHTSQKLECTVAWMGDAS